MEKQTTIPKGHLILTMFKKAESKGWEKWGKLNKRPNNGSAYQCFRKGNKFCWVGFWFIESAELGAVDYMKYEPLLLRPVIV